MTYRQLRPRTLIEQQESKLSDRPLAIIGRQSSTRQIEEHEESMRLQVEDARQRFIAQGWSPDIITIRVAGGGKRGVSGTLRIDQRAELRETLADAEAGTCKAIGVYSISRLFRDRYGVQSGTFMEICAKHDVLLITPEKTYDFNVEADVTMFTFYARFAAVENEQRAKLMKEAKQMKALRGEYNGRTLIPGFIVVRKEILIGGKLKHWTGKYIEYVPHARVVRRLYRRFRELGAQFNLLAAEVAAMDVVFPDFEDWVSPLDISRFQLKPVPGGYHISRPTLFRLLTAVEYAGYWKTDGVLLTNEDGTPFKNHDAIVPMDDWEYAFNHLSFTTLDGLPNTQRTHGVTWTPAEKVESRNVLAGILTSSIGTVQNVTGLYRVTEQRKGKSQRSTTLAFNAELIDELWQSRLIERIGELDHDAFFEEQLTKMRQRHKRELVSVDEQLARYRNEQAGIQAYIAAVGASADKPTLLKYNEDLLKLSANIADLENKKNIAQAEEEKVSQLREKIARMNELMHDRSFIQLLTHKISLDEVSSHFLTLTIYWSAPFQQVDIAYIYRPGGGHQPVSKEDEVDFRRLYPEADRLELLQRFPTMTWVALQCWADRLGVRRHANLNTSGITDRSLSWADWQVAQEHRWTLPEKGYGVWWLYDVANDGLEGLST